MIKCPSCAYENVDGTQFCEGCGEELAAAGGAGGAGAAAASAPVAGGAAADAGGIKCPACDNLNPAENVVCEVCGTELRSDAATGTSADFAGAASGAAPVAVTSTTSSGLAPATFDLDVAATTAPSAPIASAPSAVSSTPFDAALPSSAVASAATASTSAMPDDMADIPAPQTGAPVGAVPDISAPPVPAMPDVAATDAAAIPAPAPVDAAAVAPVAPVVAAGNLQPGMVKMVVEQGMSVGKQFVLGDVEIQVGREDEEESIYPDIDLSDQDEGYVHRRHATLKFENGNLTVMHLGGANKTRINNRPLPDNEAQPVQIGDKVAFGKVVLRVQSLS